LPYGTPLDRLRQVVIQAAQWPFQPRNVLLNCLVHAWGHRPQPMALRRQHLDHLAASEEQRAQRLRGSLLQGTRHRLHRFREVGQHTRINPIRFRQDPDGLSKGPDLAGVGTHHGDPGHGQRREQGACEAPRGFEHDQGRRHRLALRYEGAHTRRLIGHLPGLGGGPHSDVAGVVRDINPNKQRG